MSETQCIAAPRPDLFSPCSGIVAAGTFLGEVGNFYAFKYCLRGRAEKMEKKSPQYALLAHVVREGGFKIVLLARLSAIPGLVVRVTQRVAPG